jgi:hypothetical protein
MNTATIFYIDEQFLSGKSEPFGVRYDTQILPQGSIVVGFMKHDGRGVQEILDPPSMNKDQECHYQRVLEEARGVLR